MLKTLGLIKLLIYTLNPTPKRVHTYAERIGIQEAKIVTAQSIGECGWDYESYNARVRNNIFGMRSGKVTESNPNGYTIYENWTESVRYYLDWQNRRDVHGNYYGYLIRRGYNHHKGYVSYIRMIEKKLTN